MNHLSLAKPRQMVLQRNIPKQLKTTEPPFFKHAHTPNLRSKNDNNKFKRLNSQGICCADSNAPQIHPKYLPPDLLPNRKTILKTRDTGDYYSHLFYFLMQKYNTSAEIKGLK